MDSYKFPRTYADLEAGPPWLEGTCPDLPEFKRLARQRDNSEYLVLYVDFSWLPDNAQDAISPGGLTLKDALEELAELWEIMRPPACFTPTEHRLRGG